MKTLNLLTALPVFVLLLALAPSSHSAETRRPAPVSQKAVAGLSAYFRKEIAPLKTGQVATMNAAAFETWLRQTALPEARKKTIRQYLQPVLKGGTFEALLIKKATVLDGTYVSDLTVVRVPKAVQGVLKGVAYVTVFADTGQPSAPVIESCQYNSCYCSSENSPGLCTTTTQFNKNCPPNECPVPQGTCDCGRDGGGTNLDQVFETVYG